MATDQKLRELREMTQHVYEGYRYYWDGDCVAIYCGPDFVAVLPPESTHEQIQTFIDNNIMQVTEIRQQLELIANGAGTNPEEIDQLTRAWLCVRSSTPTSYHPVIEDRIKALGKPNTVHLTVESVGNDCISAMSLKWGWPHLQMREVITTPDEFEAFVNDCAGWDDGEDRTSTECFEEGYGVVLTMTVENWEAWLEQYEVCELDDETAALLSA